MYKLIGSPKTRAFRVMWMLNELGLEYQLDPLPPRDPSLTALNPSGKVPVLIDGPDAIIDSVAICQYLADKHGRFTFPAGTVKRAHQDSFTQFAMDDVESTLWTAPSTRSCCRKNYASRMSRKRAATISTAPWDFWASALAIGNM